MVFFVIYIDINKNLSMYKLYDDILYNIVYNICIFIKLICVRIKD